MTRPRLAAFEVAPDTGKEQLHEEMVKNLIKHFVPSEKQSLALGFLQEGGVVDFSEMLRIQEGILDAIRHNVTDPDMRARIGTDLGKMLPSNP